MYMRLRDATDRNLIAILEENARISASALARQLGIARSTINERIARLEREGVIVGYSAIIRREENLQEMRTLLFLTCERTMFKTIVDALNNLPEIRFCFTTSGQYDLACFVEGPSADDIDATIDEIANIRGVKSVDSTVLLSKKFSREDKRLTRLGTKLGAKLAVVQ